jgi:hypothetical protein
LPSASSSLDPVEVCKCGSVRGFRLARRRAMQAHQTERRCPPLGA